ncbi:MAG: Na+:solute symporter [Ignavibacteriales bacterium]|nr:MAG: Na+:solute symporter [Ignavibacteriaceae bacterium]MBW7872104.1 Na+:solute symporter [Ignavibacteria bacterium]MCZ2143738.1 Na+:solute symporter [Ignavibacteriales bacterium]OQY69789.1 MAG: sodium:proline symporter [Ignavibacteriales bacterium UTCHB3]MBV6446000.1 Sodium/glucose cotransporter [Ignavibacteriaceae bacterium]
MATVDYIIIAVYFVFSLGIALVYSKRAGKSSEEFFLSGRNLPWYLAGLSMVATTFAADTPLAVTELVWKNGISGNWIWWNFAFGGVLTVFFFAKLWRRAGIMTEVEFAEIRYSGAPAKFLRGFKAIYLGLFMNVIIIGWVNSAMIAVLTGIFGVKPDDVVWIVFLCMGLVAVYSALSGLWGVVVTDAFQFVLAMTACIILAIIVINSGQIGGIEGLKEKLPAQAFEFFPSISETSTAGVKIFSLSVFSFFAYVGIQWWASWYPGAEPGGGGYVAQRMMSAKNERHSIYATLFFQGAHYALRPWPWILAALAAVVIYPQLTAENAKMGYINIINDFMPVGLKGLMIAAFFAAYMSTVATQLNWGTSYIVNDLYRRFMQTKGTEKHYVTASRVTTIILMVVSAVVTLYIDRISGAWEFIIECGAGLGLVLIMRWYWWRINAWSEIAGMATPFILLPVVNYLGISFPDNLYILVFGTTISWLTITFLTKPEPEEKLLEFYTRVKPGGALWRSVSSKYGLSNESSGMKYQFLGWISGTVMIYSLLFGSGSLIFGDYSGMFFYLIFIILGIVGVIFSLSKTTV